MNDTSSSPISQADEAPPLAIDFDSDEPLPVCPLRKDGMADGDVCEACQ